jgi:hypothetical protein
MLMEHGHRTLTCHDWLKRMGQSITLQIADVVTAFYVFLLLTTAAMSVGFRNQQAQ